MNEMINCPTDLVGMNNQQLREALVRQLEITVESLTRLAWIVRLLEERGEDLSDLRIGLLTHLRRIAHGQVLPQLVVKFASMPLLLQRVSLLPLPDQKQLVEGGMVLLVVRRAEGFDKRMADPARMGKEQIWQVFGPDRIRSEQEQILYLEERQTDKVKTPPHGKVRADRNRQGLIVNRSFVTKTEVLEALAQMATEESPQNSTEESKIAFSLTEEEHRKLKMAAAQGDTTMTELIRHALRIVGLI